MGDGFWIALRKRYNLQLAFAALIDTVLKAARELAREDADLYDLLSVTIFEGFRAAKEVH